MNNFHQLFYQAEVAARDAKREKQDRQAELRRKKDEEREAEEHRKVRLCLTYDVVILYFTRNAPTVAFCSAGF